MQQHVGTPSLRNQAALCCMRAGSRLFCQHQMLTQCLLLQELFSPFGPISRVYIAYDRDTGENRGFAFVNFVYR